MIQLILATRNRHKVAEIQAILGERFRCRSLLDFAGAPELVEDGRTFAENAVRKASQCASWLSGFPEAQGAVVMADDSGLEVDALDGAPGVLSARFAADDRAGNATDRANNAKLLDLLRDVPPDRRTARFRCCIAVSSVAGGGAGVDGVFDGACEGTIGFGPCGDGGFGYDPLFVPRGYDRTFAELAESEKNGMSHRRAALEALGRGLNLGEGKGETT